MPTILVTPATPHATAHWAVDVTATLRDAANNVLTGRAVSWSSNNILRATVNDQGLVRTSAINKGTVTITATSEDKSGTATVRVQ